MEEVAAEEAVPILNQDPVIPTVPVPRDPVIPTVTVVTEEEDLPQPKTKMEKKHFHSKQGQVREKCSFD